MTESEIATKRSNQTAEFQKRISELENRLRELERRYQWRPIAEFHEDYGPCVVIDMIEDPGNLAVNWSNDTDFDPSEWTHFSRITQLLTKDAERMISEAREAREAQVSPVSLCPDR